MPKLSVINQLLQGTVEYEPGSKSMKQENFEPLTSIVSIPPESQIDIMNGFKRSNEYVVSSSL